MAKTHSKKVEPYPMKEREHAPVWAILSIIIGSIWIVEYYTKLDVPLVAILLVIIGFYYLIKRKV